MVGKGRIVHIHDEMYEIVRVLKVRPGAVLPTESANEIKEAWHAEKVFKHGDEYLFVNEVQTVERRRILGWALLHLRQYLQQSGKSFLRQLLLQRRDCLQVKLPVGCFLNRC